MKLNLLVILCLIWTACLGQGSTKEPMYCMPKRYADSVAYHLKKYDQLKVVAGAQAFELEAQRTQVKALEFTVAEQDSLTELDAIIAEVQGDKIKRQRKTVRLLGVAVGLETLLIILIAL